MNHVKGRYTSNEQSKCIFSLSTSVFKLKKVDITRGFSEVAHLVSVEVKVSGKPLRLLEEFSMFSIGALNQYTLPTVLITALLIGGTNPNEKGKIFFFNFTY